MPIFDNLSIDGQLQRKKGMLSLDEAQKRAGSPVAPTTPTAALLMGASPNAAQMAGGPAQLERQTSDALENADTAAQQSTAKAEGFGAVDVDDRLEQLSTDISTLGSLEGRVPAAQFKTLQEQTWGTGAPTVRELTITPDSPLAQADPEVRDALLQNKAVYVDQNGKLSFGTPNSSSRGPMDASYETVDFATGQQLAGGQAGRPSNTVAEINAAVELAERGQDEKAILGSFDEAAGIGKHVAQVTPDKMSLAQANLTPDEQAALNRVGVDSSQGQQLLKDKLRELMPQFDDITRARNIITDVTATLQDKANARKLLRQAGVSGRYTPVQKINNIVAQLEEDDQVTFFGQKKTIDELLKDDFITEMAADALKDPAMLEAMKKDPSTAEFATYLEQNRTAWSALLKPIQDQLDKVQGFRDVQQENASFGNGAPIPPDLMDALNPGWKDIRTQGLHKAAPILGALRTMKEPAAIKGVTELLMDAQTRDPSKFRELASMDLKTLQKLGLLDGSISFEELAAKDALRSELSSKIQGLNDTDATASIVGRQTANKVYQLAGQVQQLLSQYGLSDLYGNLDQVPFDAARALERLKNLTYGKISFTTGALSPKYLNSLTDTSKAAFWNPSDLLSAGQVNELVDEVETLLDIAAAPLVERARAEKEQQELAAAEQARRWSEQTTKTAKATAATNDAKMQAKIDEQKAQRAAEEEQARKLKAWLEGTNQGGLPVGTPNISI